MGSYLLKTPLTAIIFAAVWQFSAAFFPISESFGEITAAFAMPLSGYAFMLALGFWLSLVTALIMGGGNPGIKSALMVFGSFLLTQAAAPALSDAVRGEATRSMTRGDVLLDAAAFTCGMLFLTVMALLLFKPAEPATTQAQAKPEPKYKIKKLDLIIKIVVLPIIYSIFYFISWYFFLWRNQDARLHYGGPEDSVSFVEAVVAMLLTDIGHLSIALLAGIIITAGLLPTLLLLPGKRLLYILTSVMLLAGPAVKMLIPSPVMPEEVRYSLLLEHLILAVVFGALAGIMLHLSVRKIEATAPAVSTAPARPATAAGARPGAAAAVAKKPTTPAAPAPAPAKK